MNFRQHVNLKPSGRTQAMLEQAVDMAQTENVVVVGADRTHQRELFTRLRSMGCTSRDGCTLRSGGHTIYVVTIREVSRDFDGDWKLPGTTAKVFIDHAAHEEIL